MKSYNKIKSIQIDIAGSVPLLVRPFSIGSTGGAPFGLSIDTAKHKHYFSDSWLFCGGVMSNRMILKLWFFLGLHMIVKPINIAMYYIYKWLLINKHRKKS